MKRIIFSIIILIFNITIVYADDWDEIKKAAENIKSISAGFIQEKHMKILANPLISKGRFLFQAPGSLRWEYISPVRSILLLHDGNARSFIEAKNGLVEDTRVKAQAMGIVTQEITLWLKGRFDQDPNFRPEIRKEQPDTIVLIPREKSLEKIISNIEIEVSRKEGIVKSVRINEGSDSYTLIRFIEVMQNKDIDERLFKDI